IPGQGAETPTRRVVRHRQTRLSVRGTPAPQPAPAAHGFGAYRNAREIIPEAAWLAPKPVWTRSTTVFRFPGCSAAVRSKSISFGRSYASWYGRWPTNRPFTQPHASVSTAGAYSRTAFPCADPGTSTVRRYHIAPRYG